MPDIVVHLRFGDERNTRQDLFLLESVTGGECRTGRKIHQPCQCQCGGTHPAGRFHHGGFFSGYLCLDLTQGCLRLDAGFHHQGRALPLQDDSGEALFRVGENLSGKHQLQVGPGDVDGQGLVLRPGILPCGLDGLFGRQPAVMLRKTFEQRSCGGQRSAGSLREFVFDNHQFLHVHAPAPVEFLGHAGAQHGQVTRLHLAEFRLPEIDLDALFPDAGVVFQGILDAALEWPGFLCLQPACREEEYQCQDPFFHREKGLSRESPGLRLSGSRFILLEQENGADKTCDYTQPIV